jgi:alkanesulfonate monooxygenase SsuD/methylene tetrahydromethanopterin reductase-like flavin-dependent oxidoreductase (luciferase family)
MDIGIGLPNAVRGVERDGIVDWARRAEAAGFSTLGTLDRIAYPNYESLIALAAAAAVTERIRLMTDILIAPLRANTALFAKQTATIDHLSGGRVVLGLAPGGREDDYELSELEFRRRGREFDEQLAALPGLWNGEGGLGPEAKSSGGRPGVLIGGSNDKAYRRAAQFDGWTAGGAGPDAFAQAREQVVAAWKDAGRDGAPRTAALAYFALGDDPEGAARASLGDYYSFLGDYAENVVAGALKDPAAIRETVAAFREAGADELILFPASADPAQVELLAEVVFA